MIGSVAIRIFRPFVADLDAGGSSASTARPTIIFYHGGGYIVGSAGMLYLETFPLLIFYIFLSVTT